MSQVSGWDHLDGPPCFGTPDRSGCCNDFSSRSLSTYCSDGATSSCSDSECTSNQVDEESAFAKSDRTAFSESSSPAGCHSGSRWLSSQFDFLPELHVIYRTWYYTVSCGVCQNTGHALAVKSYNKESMGPENMINVTREISIMKKLQQTPSDRFPGTLQFLGAFHDERNVHVIYELCYCGSDLRSQLSMYGPGTEREVRIVAASLLQTLRCLHKSGVVHRNIKPESVFWATDGEVRLGGFSLAIEPRIMGPLTRVGQPDYCAPEVVRAPSFAELLKDFNSPGGQYDGKADVWSVGILVYELLVGATPKQMQEMYSGQSCQGSLELYFPLCMSSNCVDFLLQTLEEDASARPSAHTLCSHPWIVE